jgi:hypothetical protein
MTNRKPRCSPVRALLAPALAVGLLAASGCGGDPGGDPARFIPLGAASVARVEGQRLRGTPLERRLKAFLDRRDFLRWKYEDLAKKTGVDLLKGLDVAVIGLSEPPEGAERGELGAVARGRFDRDRVLGWVRDTIRAEGGQPRETTYGRFTIVSDPSEKWNVAVVGSRTVVAASKGWIRPMLDLVAGKGQPMAAHPEMGPLLKRVATPRVASVVTRISTERRSAMEGGPLAGVRGYAIELDAGAGLELGLQLEAVSAEEARQIGDTVRTKLKELRGADAIGRAGLAVALDAIKVETQDTVAQARLSLADAQLAELIQNVEKLMAAQLRGGLTGKGRGGAGGLGGGNPFGALLGPAPSPTPVAPPAPAPGPTK